MSDNGHRKIVTEKIIAEETRKTAERLGHFNHIDSICLKKDLSPEEYIAVYEGVLRNVMKICESRLKNSFSRKERYDREIEKVSIGDGEMIKNLPREYEKKWLERIDKEPMRLSSNSTDKTLTHFRKGGGNGRER